MGVGGAAGADVIHKENEDGEMGAIKERLGEGSRGDRHQN